MVDIFFCLRCWLWFMCNLLLSISSHLPWSFVLVHLTGYRRKKQDGDSWEFMVLQKNVSIMKVILECLSLFYISLFYTSYNQDTGIRGSLVKDTICKRNGSSLMWCNDCMLCDCNCLFKTSNHGVHVSNFFLPMASTWKASLRWCTMNWE